MEIDFESLYKQLPIILEYFVPGFIYIVTLQYFISKKSTTMDFLYSFIIGYLLKSLFSVLHQFIIPNIHMSMEWHVLILSLSALCLALATVYISQRKFVKKCFNFINHKALHNSAWLNNINYDDGTSLWIKCNDGTEILGILAEHEENGIDSWFVLSDYSIINGENESKSEVNNPDGKIFVNARDMKYVELFYGSKDKTSDPNQENISE